MRQVLSVFWVFLISSMGILFGSPSYAQYSYGGYSPQELKLNHDWVNRLEVRTPLDPLDDTLLGDNVDPLTGRLSFETVDVSLPGNSDLAVEVRRTFNPSQSKNNELADWQIAYPSIQTKIFGNYRKDWGKNRCTKPLKDSLPTYIESGPSGNVSLLPATYSDGVVMHIPGQGQQSLLDKYNKTAWPSAARKVTVKGWYLTCLSNVDGKGTEGFQAHAPNGNVYRFDVVKERVGVAYQDSWITGFSRYQLTFIHRRKYVNYQELAASQVTDVHGNWVKYKYDTAGNLSEIYSNDSRKIKFTRNGIGKTVSAATVNPGSVGERTWRYEFEIKTLSVYDIFREAGTFTNDYIGTLSKVILPDGREWKYDLAGATLPGIPGDRYQTSRGRSRVCKQRDQSVSATHPSGMKGVFALSEISLSVAVPTSQSGTPCPKTSKGQGQVRSTDIMSVMKKTLTSSNTPTMTWSYDYEPTSGWALEMITKVTRPDNSLLKYTHWKPQQHSSLGGKLKTLETFSNPSESELLEVSSTEYTVEESLGANFVIGGGTDKMKPVLTKNVITKRDGDTYTASYAYNNNQNSSSYSHRFPTSKTIFSSLSPNKRVTTVEYEHNLSKWVLGLPKTITQNGRLTDTYKWNPSKALVDEHWKYGTRVAKYSYHTGAHHRGQPYSIEDALGRKTLAVNWHRGKPTLVKQGVNTPDQIEWSQVIDDNGWVKSFKNPRRYTTKYAYDVMGRVNRITPDKSEKNWDDTIINYSFGNGAVQTISKGQSEEQVTYDSFYRPILEYKTAKDTGWSSYVNKKYGSNGLIEFVSFPADNKSSATGPADNKSSATGTNYTYDPLKRKTSENVAGSLTRYNYGAGNSRSVTDPEKNTTTRFYDGYGGPGGGDLLKIEQPLGINTLISRNIWGEVESVRQWGTENGISADETQKYYYDANRRVCRHYVPEHGATKYQYDPAGQMIAYAKGQSNSGCTVLNNSAKVTQSYDGLGRPKLTNFQDSKTPNILKYHDENGNVTHVNRGSGVNAVNWSYDYNSIDLLKSEWLELDGRSFDLNYYYDNHGHMTRTTLPTGRNISYVNDGLGRNTQLKWGSTNYVSNGSYHPDGSVAGFKYADGQVFKRDINNLLQTEPMMVMAASPNRPMA